MWVRKTLSSLFVMMLVSCNGNLGVAAMNTGISLEDANPEAQQALLTNINLRFTAEEPGKREIHCFDVNEYGLIAVGSQDSKNKFVSVYAPDGAFSYGYVFECYGNFTLEWDGDNIILYFIRSDMAALFDDAGVCLEVKSIPDTDENNLYWNQIVGCKQRTVNGIQYTMKNDMGVLNLLAPKYSQIVKTDEAGNTTIIYDVGGAYGTKIVIVSIVIALFVAICAVVIVMSTVKLKRKTV